MDENISTKLYRYPDEILQMMKKSGIPKAWDGKLINSPHGLQRKYLSRLSREVEVYIEYNTVVYMKYRDTKHYSTLCIV
jgi:hypothetical protein